MSCFSRYIYISHFSLFIISCFLCIYRFLAPVTFSPLSFILNSAFSFSIYFYLLCYSFYICLLISFPSYFLLFSTRRRFFCYNSPPLRVQLKASGICLYHVSVAILGGRSVYELIIYICLSLVWPARGGGVEGWWWLAGGDGREGRVES